MFNHAVFIYSLLFEAQCTYLLTCDPNSFVTVLFSSLRIIAYYLGVLAAHTASYNGELDSSSSVCVSCLLSCSISVLCVFCDVCMPFNSRSMLAVCVIASIYCGVLELSLNCSVMVCITVFTECEWVCCPKWVYRSKNLLRKKFR